MSDEWGLRCIGGKWYGRCAACGCLVRIDKPILGGLHICIRSDDG